MQSKINPQVKYKESPSIVNTDRGLQIKELHRIYLLKKYFFVVFGRVNTNAPKIVSYQSIYLVNPKTYQIVSRIGITETDGEKSEFLFFSFIKNLLNPEEINEKFSSHSVSRNTMPSSTPLLSTTTNASTTTPFQQTNKKKPTILSHPYLSHKNYEKKDPLFVVSNAITVPLPLEEETLAIAKLIRSEYVASSTHSWISNFMKNAHYRIRDNEGGGDCLFAVIRDAFAEIGRITTVKRLREFIAEHIPFESFETQKQLYRDLKKEQTKLHQLLLESHQQSEKIKNDFQLQITSILKGGGIITPDIKNHYNQQVLQLQKTFQEYKKEYMEVVQNLQNGDNHALAHIETFEEYKKHIRTSDYWGDEVAISILERGLQIKLILFSQSHYKQGYTDSVVLCTSDPNNIKTIATPYAPKYYIMASYTGNHYMQVFYKSKGILLFSEIPYDLKQLILTKCTEYAGKGFSSISDFHYLLAQQQQQEPSALPSPSPTEPPTDLSYNCELELVFGLLLPHEKAGHGTGETIPLHIQNDFHELDKITNWRHILDDSFLLSNSSILKIDNKQWKSITHYLSALPFKDHYPDFYHQFSLSNQFGDLPVEEVIKIADIDNLTHKSYRPTKIDKKKLLNHPDTLQSYRLMALYQKFHSTKLYKWALLLTRNTCLKQFRRHKPPIIDYDLMKIRLKLAHDIH